MQNDDVIEIDLQELFGLVLHWLWLIVVCGLVTGAVGLLVSKFVVVPQYESTTKVYILNKQNNNTLTYSDMQLGTQLTKDYAQLIKSRDVLEQVIRDATLEESYGSFAGRVEVRTLADTRIIAITVTDDDPVMAQYLADEVRKVAAEHIKKVMDIEAVNVAETANLPGAPASPNIPKWTVIGFLIGAFVCAMIIVIRYLVDDTIKTSEDVERYLGLSTLAMIPTKEEESKKKRKNRKESEPNIRYEFNTSDSENSKQETEYGEEYTTNSGKGER